MHLEVLSCNFHVFVLHSSNPYPTFILTARKEVDRLIAELQDAQFKLELIPTQTLEYVESLTFLDEIQERIEPLQREAQIVNEMYELIEQFTVPTPPEDFAVYQVGLGEIDYFIGT